MDVSAVPEKLIANRLTLLHADFVVPVVPANTVHVAHSVLIENGVVRALMPSPEAKRTYPQAESVDLTGHVLLPGLVNMHTHSPMTLLRGYADDMELHRWLQEHIWPAESRFVGPEFVRDGSLLAIAEMLRGGTTCFNDMYFFFDETLKLCLQTGIRASVGIPLIEIETPWAADIERYFAKGLAIHERWRDDPLISFTLSPHAPYTVSDDTLRRIAALSDELAIPVHLHLLETDWEIRHSLQQHGLHPLARLQRFGLLNEKLQAVHMAHLSAADIDQLATHRVHVIHCPQSNLKLASGMCPVDSLLRAGVNVALGTDGAASNNDLDLLAEAQTAALLAKGISGNARAVDAFQALEMLTINGARALGQSDRIGSIEPGKQADLCALNLVSPETQPLHHVVSQVIYAASRGQISDVWVSGKRL
ncbi:MAG: TRZ/ATZ family hydrolase, partial [Xanthomonadales bacterium]|nr:TRZ/ATZ family hydrolase [Xanthomonadales bacterium]